jgi:hypothetical protein
MGKYPTPLANTVPALLADLNRRVKLLEVQAANPVAVGGILAQSNLQSPNYNPATGNGWSINADGSASLQAVTLTHQPSALNQLVGDDGSFTSSTGHWTASQNCTIAQSLAPDGVTDSLVVTILASGTAAIVVNYGFLPINVTPGDAVTVASEWWSTASGLSIQQSLVFEDAFGNSVSGGTVGLLGSVHSMNVGSFGGISDTFTAPAGAAIAAGMTITITGVSTNNTIVYGAAYSIADPTTPGTGLTAGGEYLYSGTPAFGNLVGSWTPANNVDIFGNQSSAGLTLSGMPMLVYSGTPALDNLIISINPGAATFDVFGNYIAEGINHFINASSLTVNISNGQITFGYITGVFQTLSANAQLTYGGSGGALGTLTSSQAGVAGTDQYGNAVLAGYTNYAVVSGTYVATNFADGMISLYTASGPGGPYTSQAALTLGSGGTLSIQTNVPITFTNFTGSLPTTLSTILSNSTGEMQAVNALDGQRYNITHSTHYTTAGSGGQTFNTTSPVSISGLSASLGVGTYEVTARVFGTCPNSGGSHTFTFAFTGTATGIVNAILWQPQASNAAPTQSTLMDVTPFTSGLTSPPQINTGAWADIYGILTVTAAGTLTLNCQVSNTGDPYIVEQGSYLRIMPT